MNMETIQMSSDESIHVHTPEISRPVNNVVTTNARNVEIRPVRAMMDPACLMRNFNVNHVKMPLKMAKTTRAMRKPPTDVKWKLSPKIKEHKMRAMALAPRPSSHPMRNLGMSAI